jgi:hypothetical protein
MPASVELISNDGEGVPRIAEMSMPQALTRPHAVAVLSVIRVDVAVPVLAQTDHKVVLIYPDHLPGAHVVVRGLVDTAPRAVPGPGRAALRRVDQQDLPGRGDRIGSRACAVPRAPEDRHAGHVIACEHPVRLGKSVVVIHR